jgi:Uma2 family endonuclease
MSVMPPRHVVTVDEFDRMVEGDVFGADERVELIEGEIVDMSPIGSRHQACVDRLSRLFAPLFVSDRAIVRVQGAFRASDISMPQPDVALLRPKDNYYDAEHPHAHDLLLAVEVADTSLRYDRWTKLPAYAKAGVPEAWVVDLTGHKVDVAVEPSLQGYGQVGQIKIGDTLAPAAFPDVAVDVSWILGIRD